MMGWLKRYWGIEPLKGESVAYERHPENPGGSYWHPILIHLDKSLFRALERPLSVHLADELTKIERDVGHVTHITIIEINIAKLFVSIICRIEPHTNKAEPKPKTQLRSSDVPNASTTSIYDPNNLPKEFRPR